MENPDFLQPRQWPANYVPLLLDIAAIIQSVFVKSYAWCHQSQIPSVRLAEQLHRADCMTTALQEIVRILSARITKVPSKKRPHYEPEERMAILLLREKMSWSIPKTAQVFLLNAATIRTWIKRAGDDTDNPLLKVNPPVNKFPDVVRFVTLYLKRFYPKMGKRRIANLLSAAGLAISISTVGRMLNSPNQKPPKKQAKISGPPDKNADRLVTAKYPNHVWHIDLSVVPIHTGMATRLWPHNLSPVWPFAWIIATVVDHYSRKVMATTVFHKEPTSLQIRNFLGRLIASVGCPKYIISDKGTQFWSAAYKAWCRRKKIKPRFGAVGQRGSIAIIERFFRSLKSEFLRSILIPMSRKKMLQALNCHRIWFNRHRPHQGLDGALPDDIYDGSVPKPEPIDIRNPKGGVLQMRISHYKHFKELPVVELKKAA